MASISFSGLASGIDADAIIKSTTETKKLQLIPLQNTVAFNDQESEGLEEFLDALHGGLRCSFSARERMASASTLRSARSTPASPE